MLLDRRSDLCYGQIWLELFMYFGMDKEDSASYTTLILILESAILTGLNVYPKIAKKVAQAVLSQ